MNWGAKDGASACCAKIKRVPRPANRAVPGKPRRLRLSHRSLLLFGGNSHTTAATAGHRGGHRLLRRCANAHDVRTSAEESHGGDRCALAALFERLKVMGLLLVNDRFYLFAICGVGSRIVFQVSAFSLSPSQQKQKPFAPNQSQQKQTL